MQRRYFFFPSADYLTIRRHELGEIDGQVENLHLIGSCECISSDVFLFGTLGQMLFIQILLPMNIQFKLHNNLCNKF